MKPFLKWAGNKYGIIERIKSALPAGKRLIEPFVGSGAVFLNTDFNNYYLSEANEDLVRVFNTLKHDGERFVDSCREYFTPDYNTEEQYYNLRELFNATRDPRLFVYLNKHCFNGLCRYNKNNQFNTPFGKYKKPYFPEKEMKFFHEKSQQAVFVHEDFSVCMDKAEVGDVIYCDPPYVPLSKTSSFTSYQKDSFGETEQRLLAEKARECQSRGIPVIISNHLTDFTQELYSTAEIIAFDVKRMISAKSESRQKVKEILGVFGL
ncbi:MAG: Dam family site-specific DNA-(adenine-N6)-methyltransferase [Gammaproteobacteria bacterium]|nr:Dam family site-specific DNA-(adenine-N6)-methyltransferase [Gammaproteobacteria bacterium]